MTKAIVKHRSGEYYAIDHVVCHWASVTEAGALVLHENDRGVVAAYAPGCWQNVEVKSDEEFNDEILRKMGVIA